MEIHKPKPFHNLKEFGSEILTIVVGILIALGLEQAIEAIHRNERRQIAVEMIEKEIRTNIGEAVSVSKVVDCSKRQMTALTDALGRGDQKAAAKVLRYGHFHIYGVWLDAAWTNNLSSGTLDGIDDEKRLGYSIFYAMVREQHVQQERIASALDRLEALTGTGMASSQQAIEAELPQAAELAGALREYYNIGFGLQASPKALLGITLSRGELDSRPHRNEEAACESAAKALVAG